MAHVFVSEFPADEARAIGRAILARKFTPELIRSAWVVAEYALGEMVPANLIGAGQSPLSDADRDEAARALLAMADAHPDAPMAGASIAVVFPWARLVAMILALIIEQVSGSGD